MLQGYAVSTMLSEISAGPKPASMLCRAFIGSPTRRLRTAAQIDSLESSNTVLSGNLLPSIDVARVNVLVDLSSTLYEIERGDCRRELKVESQQLRANGLQCVALRTESMGKTACKSTTKGRDGTAGCRKSQKSAVAAAAAEDVPTRCSALVFARVELDLVASSGLGNLVLDGSLGLVELLLCLALEFCERSAAEFRGSEPQGIQQAGQMLVLR